MQLVMNIRESDATAGQRLHKLLYTTQHDGRTQQRTHRRRDSMRTQLRNEQERTLAMCPVVHNISGQMAMDRPVRVEYVNSAGKVCARKNFGNTRCMYTVIGNILFRPGRSEMLFKGVRSVAAMKRTLRRATGGEIVHIRVSMLVMTIQMQHCFSVCEQSPLERALVRVCGAGAVQMLPRSEEESNAIIFRIHHWERLLPGEAVLATEMDELGCIVSISRLGTCTLRASSHIKGSLEAYLVTQQLVHNALHLLARFILDIDLTE